MERGPVLNYRLSLEERKALNLLKLRGYKVIERVEQGKVISFLASKRGREKVLVWCVQDKIIGVAYIEKLRKALKSSGVKDGIIVACNPYTFAAKRKARHYEIELIPRNFPTFDLFKHKLVPKHEVLSPKEREDLLKRYRVERYQLPMIKSSDIVAVAIGAKPGDVIKVTRESPTAGKHVSYRYVVPG